MCIFSGILGEQYITSIQTTHDGVSYNGTHYTLFLFPSDPKPSFQDANVKELGCGKLRAEYQRRISALKAIAFRSATRRLQSSRFGSWLFLCRITIGMEVLNRNIALFTPKMSVIGSCNARFNVSDYRRECKTRKRVEFSNEVLISRALTTYYNLTSYADSDIVVYNKCPYSRHMHSEDSDPFGAARSFNENENDERPIADRKPCVYMALHPLSYPKIFNKMRFCTALVEDKTVNGDDEDLVVPSGALKYPVIKGMNRSCLLSYFGNPKKSKEFDNIRFTVSDEIGRLNFSKVCRNIHAVGAEYIHSIQRSKWW